jgi:cation:H+ antiporter
MIEATQTTLSLTVVGFSTAFELIVLAWSTARRGVPEAAVAAVKGSFVYNVTMTLGAAAVVRPLTVLDATLLHISAHRDARLPGIRPNTCSPE